MVSFNKMVLYKTIKKLRYKKKGLYACEQQPD